MLIAEQSREHLSLVGVISRAALRRLPETRETTEVSVDIHIDLRNALLPLGDYARTERLLQMSNGLPIGGPRHGPLPACWR
jgi:hypothetical protein